jgi:hypothetical protein
MAWTAADQVSKAQRIYIEGIYDAYQHQPDFLRFIESETEEVPTNYLGRQVSLEVSANPSLAFGNMDGGDFATPSNPTLNNFLVTYQWMNSGFEATYASIMNNNKETVGDPFEKAVQSSAKQFAQWMNYYVSGGNGTTALATASANYSGGTPAAFTANGTTDSFGATRVINGQRGYIYDSTGTTQRTGTVGAGVLTILSHTRTVITFTTNAPSDFVIGDIFVPEGGNQVGIKGLPYLVNNTGNYFNQSRTAVPQIQSQVIAVGGALTANALLQLYGQVAQVAGLDDDANTDWMSLAMPYAQWYNYMGLITPVSFQHYGSDRPSADIGSKSLQTTWFGVRMRKFFWLPGNDIYMLNMKDFKMAVLKKAGAVDARMPANDWVQAINGDTSNYRTAKQRWSDFAGDLFCRRPFAQGRLATVTMSQLMQKQVYPQ